MNTDKAYAYKIAGEYAPKEARKFIAPMILDSRKDRARICLNHASRDRTDHQTQRKM